jgi:hypothetical protein
MKTFIRYILILLAAVCTAGAQTAPSLSLSLLSPGIAQISWPSNFAGWHLMSVTNPGSSASWQAVPGTPLPLGNTLVVFYPLTNNSRFFRLQQSGGGGETLFQATPSTIAQGGSSTLSWNPVAGTTYQLFPGPGTVTGSNYVVFPTVTTVYSLIASNQTGVTTNTTTVTVTSATCQFAGATGYDCTLSFSYVAQPASASYVFDVSQQATLTFHFSRVSLNGNLAVYTTTLGGNASVNDSETIVGSPPPITVIGSGAPSSGQPANLTIDCGAGTYTFDVQPVISANWNGSAMDTRVGSVYVNNRALPLTYGVISSSESLPARGPFWNGSGDWYFPGGLGPYMFYDGLVTDTSAGSANVSWSFTPKP